jgi:enoyl-CoA hydratase/carnithine racemase
MTEVRSDLAARVLTVTVDREHARNTITYPVLDALLETLERADADPGVPAIVVTGTGRFFSAGFDLSAGSGHSRLFREPFFEAVEVGDAITGDPHTGRFREQRVG